ncbi:hypothetical protein AMTR_s00049p00102670 [Amborella trichopoda]|uniref:Uncharacterized protein n=1 Tax=Amborella trichopoda TaxID=13333 RepID=W1Q0S5_AMBTC|nr:hypothetical protein AMTR_s00049p00102670 [Amborella trichopoda]
MLIKKKLINHLTLLQNSQEKTSSFVIKHPALIHLQRCEDMKTFKEIHAHFIVMGLTYHPFTSSRLLAFCFINSMDYAIRFSHKPEGRTSSPSTL